MKRPASASRALPVECPPLPRKPLEGLVNEMHPNTDAGKNKSAAPVERPPTPNPLPCITSNIPDFLKRLRRWILWAYTLDEKRGDWSKQPYQPNGQAHLAKANDPKTWGSFDVAERVFRIFRQSKGYDGLGFVLGDGICGVDLDGCLRPDRTLEPWAAEIVAAFNCYTEVSPSGTGLKMFCRGTIDLPPFKTGVSSPYLDGELLSGDAHCTKERKIEIYHERKYFCVTGQRWPEWAVQG